MTETLFIVTFVINLYWFIENVATTHDVFESETMKDLSIFFGFCAMLNLLIMFLTLKGLGVV